MSSAFKRKTYGRVRPVPQPKPKAPVKPSVNELKVIYRAMQKAPSWQINDYLSKALLWWNDAIPYIAFKRKTQPISTDAARAYIKAQTAIKVGHAATSNETKVKDFTEALTWYARYAVGFLKVPAIQPYMKRSKESVKKEKVRTAKLADRFDSVLTLLEKCFTDSTGFFDFSLKVSTTDEDVRYDHELSTIYYSKDRCLEMKKVLHKQGLLALVLAEAETVARITSIRKASNKNGLFIPSDRDNLIAYKCLLRCFERFAHTTDAPRTLVKREKKVKKVGNART